MKCKFKGLNLINRPVISALALLLLPMSAHGSESKLGLNLSTWVSAGYGRARVVGESKSPDIGQYIVGLDYGLRYGSFFLGAITDYRFLNQYSADDATGYGNRRGTRFVPIAPSVAIAAKNWSFRFDYQPLGNYNLTYTNSGNKVVAYTKPKGYRLQVRKYLQTKSGSDGLKGPFLGFLIERVAYSETLVGGKPQPCKMNVDQVGFSLGWGF